MSKKKGYQGSQGRKEGRNKGLNDIKEGSISWKDGYQGRKEGKKDTYQKEQERKEVYQG